jgi:hypothetical protein
VAGPSLTVALDGASKRVRVEASASGYRSYDESVDVSADQVIKIRMTKRKKAPPGGGLMEPD